MMKKKLLTLAIVGLLTACADGSPPSSLSKQLEGKTPEQRQEILRLACLNEAEYSSDLNKAKYQRRYGSKRSHLLKDTEETARLKTLCREMTDNATETR